MSQTLEFQSWRTRLSVPLIALLISLNALVNTMIKPAYAMNDKVGEGIQLIQKGQLNAANARLAELPTPYTGEALFLAARIAEYQHQWTKAMALYRQYLSEHPFSVHALEARVGFALLRSYRNDPLLKDFLYPIQLRDRYALKEMQAVSAKLYHAHPTQALAIRGQLLVAYSLLEAQQDAAKAYALYQQIALATSKMSADWYIQALFGAMFASIRLGDNLAAERDYRKIEAHLNSLWGSRNSLLARSWQQRLKAMQFLITTHQQPHQSNSPLLWGVGARLMLDTPAGSNQDYRPIWQHLNEHQLPVNSVTLWITQNSDWRWLRSDLLQGAHTHGYVPMINYWFFGDEISPEYVTEHKARYLSEIETKLIPLLKDLPHAYLILEPEFNKQGIESWEGWDPLMLQVITLIRQHAPQIKIGLGLGDWDQPGGEPSYLSAQRAIEASDFVASMLMLSSYTERAHAAPDWSAWIRVLRLGDRLKQRFNKPWMLAYLSIASEPNWQYQQANELDKLHFYLPLLKKQGLFALNWFSLIDEPNQQGWFADAEQSFGLLNRHYQRKPAFAAFQQLVNQQHSTPENAHLVAFHSSITNNNLQLSATLSHWSPWKVTLRQGSNIWQKQGVGDHFTLDWQGQMLPRWSDSDTIVLDLDINGTVNRQQDILWTQPGVHSQTINQRVSLHQWQNWQLLPQVTIHPTALGATANQSIELVLEGLTTTQLSSLRIGLKDAHGFTQTLLADGYVYTKDDQVAVYLPLSEFRYPWVRFIDNQAVWRQHSSGALAIMIENTGVTPSLFEVKKLNIYQHSP